MEKKEFPRIMMVSDDKQEWKKRSIVEITNLGYAVAEFYNYLEVWKHYKEVGKPKLPKVDKDKIENFSKALNLSNMPRYKNPPLPPKPKKKKLVELLREYNKKVCKIWYWTTHLNGKIELYLDGKNLTFKSKKELKKHLINEIERNGK